MAEEHKSDRSEGHKEHHKAEHLGQQTQASIKKAVHYAQGLHANTIAYIILIAGLLLLLFAPPIGAALVGGVFGVYFADNITVAVKHFADYFQREQLARTIIFLAFLLALIVATPMLFLGILITVSVVSILGYERKPRK